MGLFTGIFAGGAKGLLDGASDIIGKFVEDPTKKAELTQQLAQLNATHIESMEKLANDALAAQMKDVQDARNREIQLNESANAGWLSKNVISLLAIFVSTIWGGLTVYLLLRMLAFIASNPNVKMDVVLSVYAALSTTMGILMNYYFGTSHSAVEKDKTIASIAKQP